MYALECVSTTIPRYIDTCSNYSSGHGWNKEIKIIINKKSKKIRDNQTKGWTARLLRLKVGNEKKKEYKNKYFLKRRKTEPKKKF